MLRGGGRAVNGPADDNPRLAAALAYLRLGWSVLPLCPPDHAGAGSEHSRKCKSPGKAPVLPWKEYQRRLPAEAEVREWWRYHAGRNVGLALGPVSGLVRVDLEGLGADALRRKGDLPVTLTFPSGRRDGSGWGLLYATPPGVELRTTVEPMVVGELRLQGRGAQSALPPSRHKDGGLYAWLPGRGPGELEVATMPDWMVDAMRAGRGGQGPRALRPGEVWTEGTRNTSLTSLAGTLRRRGAGADELKACLDVFNLSRCDPPLDDDEVAAIAESVAKYEPARKRFPFGGREGS
jgi:hypothetical protein